jgi:hypothetical protein
MCIASQDIDFLPFDFDALVRAKQLHFVAIA